MDYKFTEDTIAAIATPFGEGGIGIIRISGEESERILYEIFKRKPEVMEDRKMTYGHIVGDDGRKIDEVLAVVMRAPRTYTGEDVVEIDCHGGIVPLQKTLELVLSKGARLAEKGEFTKRAFLNGRIDLSQAEAVMDLVKAKADKTYDVALDQLEGAVSRRIRDIRSDIMDILVDLTVNIDYPDEDIEIETYSKLDTGLSNVKEKISKLIESSQTGKIISEGLKVAIVGKPNVGKSSLLNSLLKETRAIVTDVPGTTRDTIEETLNVKGIPVVLIDTAGIRETEDRVESIGIEKSKESLNKADLAIFVMDANSGVDDIDRGIIEYLDPKKTIVVLNKMDLDVRVSSKEISALLPSAEIIETSIKNDEGVDLIENAIVSRVYKGEAKQEDSAIITNARHKNLLEKAGASIDDAMELSGREEPFEIIEIEVNDAYETLGEIIGETVQDDILNEVFSRFCLGK
ncbi:MAG: tRNA uridine-5-carboxymethylaminomethyl(34) synthesis GTPase MnmE [Eubacteriales bacterium]|nr:tRNA uridine-5-carboxymethylaminomethyl(34) synthesis GTPase MnmE [Eubacteriales bacterium]